MLPFGMARETLSDMLRVLDDNRNLLNRRQRVLLRDVGDALDSHDYIDPDVIEEVRELAENYGWTTNGS